MKKNLLVFLMALLMFLALLAPTPALAANVNVTFSIIDQNGNNIAAGLSGDVELVRYSEGEPAELVATWPANTLPQTKNIEVNETSVLDFYVLSLKEINPGYAHPGEARFRVRADGTMVRYNSDEEIYEKNKVWLSAYRTDDTATLHVWDVDNPGVDVSGVRMRFVSGHSDDKGCESELIFFDSASGGMKVWLWPRGMTSSGYYNMLNIADKATIPAGYEVADECLEPDLSTGVVEFRRENEGGGYRVDVKYPKDADYSPNPNGTKVVFWLKKSTLTDVNVRAMDADGVALAGVPLNIQEYDEDYGWISHTDYPEDYTSEAPSPPWELQLNPGRYKISKGTDDLPTPYIWRHDVEIDVAADGTVKFKRPEASIWKPAESGNTVPVKLDRGAVLIVKKVDENENLFLTETQPGYDAEKTAWFVLNVWDPDVSMWCTVGGSQHNTKDQNPWEYHIPAGDYYLKEFEAPWYYKAVEDYYFRVKEDGTIFSLIGFTEHEEITEIKVENERIPVYPIRFSVIDKADSAEISGVKVDLNKGNGDYLDGWTTDGNIKTIELPEAEYEFDYMIGGGYAQGVWLKFRVNGEGKVDIFNPKTSTWVPTGDNLVQLVLKKGVPVILRKIDAANPAAELAGASLKLEEVTTPPNTGFSYGWISGKPEEFFLKKGASYIYSEITAPGGYAMLGEEKFRIAENGDLYVEDLFGNEHLALSNTLVMVNSKESFLDVFLNARDKTGTPANLAGAKLVLQQKVGSNFVTLPWHAYVSKNVPREIYLALGTYRLLSIMPPDGYVDDVGYTEFKVTEGGLETTYPTPADPPDDNVTAHINFVKAEAGTINIKVNKVWNDNNNQDGLRPESVRVDLLADGEPTELFLILNEANLWQGSFQNMADGKNYTLREVSVAGYSSVIEDDVSDGFTITNTHTPSKIDIDVTEVWNDKDNQVGKRPDSVRVRLLADGTATGKWMDITKAGGWKGSFTGVDEYKGGKKIVYTIEQDPIGEGYTSVITGNAASGFVVTNTRAPSKIDIEVAKIWKDSDNKALKRPDSVTLRLYANGKDSGIKLEITKAGGWKGTFTGVDEYKDGKKIVYTVRENPVQYYKYAVKGDAAAGFTVTNTYSPYVNVFVPKTGDASNLQLYAGICLLAAAGLASLLYWKYLKKQKEESAENTESE